MKFNGKTREQIETERRAGIQCFALFPRKMRTGHWLWFERYWRVWVPTHSGNGYWSEAQTLHEATPKYPVGPRVKPKH
jgi:hypothetical protein